MNLYDLHTAIENFQNRLLVIIFVFYGIPDLL